MVSPSNLNLALIPFENPENLFELPVGMFIDPCGITHLAYPLIEEASIQGERRNQSLGSDFGDETIARSEVHKYPQRNKLILLRTRDAMLLDKSTKKTRPVQSKFVLPSNRIEIDDDDIIGPKKSRKQKRNTSKPEESGPKEIDEIDSARALSFRRRNVIRGRVITGFGGDEMSELLALVQAR
ncbi:hypothetical protein KY289_023065 [Solanum tuberosum]|nr:hypothetical protein KY289_023065 [Solanum tuberosum]